MTLVLDVECGKVKCDNMKEVARHTIGEQQIAQALDGIEKRAFSRWESLRYDRLSLESLEEMCDELLDHVAAGMLEDPALSAAHSRVVLRTAAECALGVLDLGVFPNGDFEVPFPLLGTTLSSEEVGLGDAVDRAPTARTWLDAFALCLVSGVLWERNRVIGLLLRQDFAPQIHDGVPYSPPESRSDQADLAEMDALCGYLTVSPGHLPSDWPAVVLCKPDFEERAEAARRLDALGVLTPDQRLLRVLLDDDQPAFETALADRLVQHRDVMTTDAPPRSLLPINAIALASLAVQVHGWELSIRSGYLPDTLLRAPKGTPKVGI
ncbi:immunity 49 family protein [Nocardia sp. NPDC050710]|uniref:immunity 49 family protein n=1 Tax=Nocardia sp. NPDC050710 TaxID=3157220 RepID=UPI0033F538BA